MKNIIIIVVFLVFSFEIRGQNQTMHNPLVRDAEIVMENPSVTGQMSFVFALEGSDYQYREDRPVQFSVCMLNGEATDGLASIGGNVNEYFRWIEDPYSGCLLAFQKSDIIENEQIYTVIDVRGTERYSTRENGKIGFIVNIQPAPSMNGYNKLEDDSTSKVYVRDGLTTIDEAEILQVEVYPNPFSERIEISTSTSTAMQVELYSVDGKLVHAREYVGGSRQVIKTEGYEAGEYILQISQDGMVTNKRLVKVNK